VWPILYSPLINIPSYHEVLEKGGFLHSQTIALDLSRTFPDNKYFDQQSSQYKSLNNMLNVLSVVFPKMGYCQGLNFICAVVLLKLQEE
jgi:hypothetical protein